MTVRELVREAQREMLAGDFPPAAAREWQNKLTALLGNCQAEIRKADADYNRIYSQHFTVLGKASHARIVAEASEEYQRKVEARDTEKLVQEMLRTIRANMRSLSEELRHTA